MTDDTQANAAETLLEKPFLAHLEDLRTTVLRSVLALLVGMIAITPFVPGVVALLKIPLARVGRDPETFLQIFQVAGGMTLVMRVIFWGGLILALPVMGWLVGAFIFPGLRRHEKKVVLRGVIAAAGLFVAGVLMGYFMMLHVAISMMLRISEWVGTPPQFILLGDYIGFCLKLLLAFGLSFELPIVVLVLNAMGFVSGGDLRRKRRHVIVGLLVVAMLLTPSDPYTMVLMAIPMALLYEASIWLVWLRERRADRARA